MAMALGLEGLGLRSGRSQLSDAILYWQQVCATSRPENDDNRSLFLVITYVQKEFVVNCSPGNFVSVFTSKLQWKAYTLFEINIHSSLLHFMVICHDAMECCYLLIRV